MINLSSEQQRDLNTQMMNTGRNVLERSIIIGTGFFVTIVRFIWDGIKQVIGK